eukprot:g17582.t1
MKPSTPLIVLTSVGTCLVLGTHGFVAPGSNLPGGVISSRTHDISPRGADRSSSSSRPVFPTRHAPRRHRNEPSSLLMMAAGKKRRRRKGDKGGASADASGVSTASMPKQPAGSPDGPVSGGGAGPLGDVLERDRQVEELFTDDWSDMPGNAGMVKSNVPLPDISEFKSTRRAETTLEQREKKTARGLVVGAAAAAEDDAAVPASRLSGFESKLTPIVDREEERRKKSAAERFEEGPIVKGLKTVTWFSICTLVLWEIYINSPWFTPPASPPPIL